MEDRVIKLLEVATHPSTGDGERANAIAMFRKATDAKGGVKAFITGEREDARKQSFDDFENMMKAMKRATRLEYERDTAIRRLNRLRTALTSAAGDDDLTDPVAALYGALTDGWQTLGQLVERARRNGFNGAENTIRKRADNLAAAGAIEVREGDDCGYARAWRLKP